MWAPSHGVKGEELLMTAYGNTQVTSSIIGGAQGLAAAFGLFGSLSFPLLRRRIGLNNVGVLGLGLEVAALIPCIVSIWLPGSSFDPSALHTFWHPAPVNNSHIKSPNEKNMNTKDMFSIATFFSGIIVSRYGLWLSDITITQIMQEQIIEHKRGVINGVQDSLNMGMDMVKSVLVIMFPYPQQFGLLIILSFISIFLGFLSYMIYFFTNGNSEMQSDKDSTEDE
ncbi:ferroportin-like isoform X2 [Periplaneta americana]|uniref:ferroportin-like isoform X2 n=1 Tax=Periplaneta americana TaxID=6978 RepID=UPI0037E9A688